VPLAPVSRRSITDNVFDQIAAQVLAGDVVPGETLPSERRLAEVLGVSRPSVREALQQLSRAGLVDVRQGDGTTVRDFRQTAGLDLLPRLLFSLDRVDLAAARSVLEVRLHVGPFVAELAARRGGASLEPALSSAMAHLAAQDDSIGRQHAALAYWDVLVDGADSIALRLMYNGLRQAYVPIIDALAGVMDAEVSDHAAYRKLAAAVAAGRPTAAASAAKALLTLGSEALLAVFDALEESP